MEEMDDEQINKSVIPCQVRRGDKKENEVRAKTESNR